jgi:general stress protein YciG
MSHTYKLSKVHQAIKVYLEQYAKICDRETANFQNELRFIHQIYNGEWEESEAIIALCAKRDEEGGQSFTPDSAREFFKSVVSFGGHEQSYREWAAHIIPFATRCHFECIAFGRRLHRKCSWSELSNSRTNKILEALRKNGKIPFGNTTKMQEYYDSAGRRGGNSINVAAQIVYWFARRSVIGGRVGEFGDIGINEGFEPDSRPPRRTATIEHNVTRFGSWYLNNTSSREWTKIRAVWLSSGEYFRSEFARKYGQTFYDQIERECSEATFSESCGEGSQ